MSLQGSLETFSIPDVLVLLSSTKKTGELRVVGGQVDGRVWFDGGGVVQATVGGSVTTPVDGVFEILRLLEGTFSFNTDVKAPKPGASQPVEMILADAQARLSEWHEIAKVVPHLDCTLSLAPELPDDEVVVERSQWQIMVKVAGGASVRQLMDAAEMSEFDACQAVRRLIDGGLLSIDTSVKPRSGRAEPAKAMSVPVDEAVPGSKPSVPAAANGSSGANGSSSVNGSGGASGSSAASGGKADEAKEAAATADAPAPPKSAQVTAEKRPTTAADEARKEGKDSQVIRSHSTRPDSVAVSTTKGSPATAPLDPEAAKDTKPAAKAEPRNQADAKTNAKDDLNPLVAQLAALGVDEDDAEIQEKVAKHLAEGGELPQPEGDEPINRGLLLKFLSSVRN